MKLKIGTLLQDRYEIIEPIGSGGMSKVYKAHCHKLNRLVAIKVLKEEFSKDNNFVYKFKLEAQSAAGLNHPNIVNVYDVIDEQDLHYIVMEYVEGITLKEYIKSQGILDIKEAIDIAISIAKGVKAAHDAGIIHRDIKPQNIIISKDRTVKVSDFGIAKAVSENTISNVGLASVHYMSPEQAKGATCDNRTDIYSLGILMYEMLTGTLPFGGDVTVSVALAHIEERMPRASEINNKVSKELDNIISTCTRKSKERRYFDIVDLIKDLENILAKGLYEVKEDIGSTRIISASELTAINNKLNKTKKVDDEMEEDSVEDKKVDKLVSIFGSLLAIIIVFLIAYFVFSKFNLFSLVSGKKNNILLESDEKIDIKNNEVIVPNVKDLTYDMSKKILEERGLKIKLIKKEESEFVEKDKIISQSLTPGTKTNKDSIVEVVLSLGIDKVNLEKFSLLGKNKDLAILSLKNNGFLVEEILENSEEIEIDKVIKYEPSLAKKGEVVKLYISKGKKEDEFIMPELTSFDIDQVKKYILDNNLTLGLINSEYSDEYEKGVVMAQNILPGSSFIRTTPIDLVVSLGKEEKEYKYIASIDRTYNLTDLVGPGGTGSTAIILIRLKQNINGEDVYKTLMEQREVAGDTILPVRFKSIEGVYGIDTGYVEIVEVKSNTILKSYQVDFFKVE